MSVTTMSGTGSANSERGSSGSSPRDEGRDTSPQASPGSARKTVQLGFVIDDEEFEESDDDDPFPPPDFDFARVLEQVTKEISEEDEELPASNLESEIVTIGRAAALEMGYVISADEIMKSYEEDKKLLEIRTTTGVQATVENLHMRRSDTEDDNFVEGEPASKKLKLGSEMTEGTSSRNNSTASSASSNTQYVFVVEKSSSEKKVISLQKGEQLPEGFELASIRENFAAVPGEVSTICIEAVSKAQKQNCKQLSPSTSAGPGSSSAAPNIQYTGVPLSKTQEKRVSPTSGKRSSGSGLTSLSNLMTQELVEKSKKKTRKQILISFPRTNDHLQRPGPSSRLTEPISSFDHGNGSPSSTQVPDSSAAPVLDIISSGSDDEDQNHNPSPTSPSSPSSIKISNVISLNTIPTTPCKTPSLPLDHQTHCSPTPSCYSNSSMQVPDGLTTPVRGVISFESDDEDYCDWEAYSDPNSTSFTDSKTSNPISTRSTSKSLPRKLVYKVKQRSRNGAASSSSFSSMRVEDSLTPPDLNEDDIISVGSVEFDYDGLNHLSLNSTSIPSMSSSSTQAADSLAAPSIDIIPVGSDYEDSDEQTDQNLQTTSFKIPPAPKPAILSQPPSCQQNVSIPSCPFTREQPRSLAPLLKCQHCEATFLCFDDYLFRMHLLLKHDLDFDSKHDGEYFEQCRLGADNLPQCHNCGSYMVKNSDHQNVCQSAFSVVPVEPNKLLKHVCAFCEGKPGFSAFSAIYELKHHILKCHRNIWRKVILTWGFKCAQCLKSFDSSLKLLKHSIVCEEHPTPKTIYELSKSFIHCDICDKAHSTATETIKCYEHKKLLRCVLCLDVYREKYKFYDHMKDHHGLQTGIIPGQPPPNRDQLLLLPCNMCPQSQEDQNKRWKVHQLFNHIVDHHFQQPYVPVIEPEPIVSSSVNVEDQAAQRDTRFESGERETSGLSMQPLPPPVGVNQTPQLIRPVPVPEINFNPNPTLTPRMTTATPIIPGVIPSTTLPPGAYSFQYVEVNGVKTLMRLQSAIVPTPTGGVRMVQSPALQPTNNFVPGNHLQSAIRIPLQTHHLVRPVAAAARASTSRYSARGMSSTNNPYPVIRPRPLVTTPCTILTQPPNVSVTSTSAFTISTSSQPMFSNMSSSSTTSTFASPSSAFPSSLPIRIIPGLPQYVNDIPISAPVEPSSLPVTPGTSRSVTPPGFVRVRSPNSKISQHTATATITSESQSSAIPDPNIAPSSSVQPVDGGTRTTSSTSGI